MNTQKLKTPPKISVKIWKPVMDKLDQKFDALCLRRDAYLNKLLARELSELDSEIPIPNSLAAQRFIAQRLDTLDRNVVSLTLNAELVAQLNAICQERCIPRDAYFNRLFLVLAASPQVIDRLYFGGPAHRAWTRLDNEFGGDFWQPGCYPLNDGIDPFWAIRPALELLVRSNSRVELVEQPEPESGRIIELQKDLAGGLAPVDSVYASYFSDELKDVDLRGMNCYMPDWRIPNTDAASEHARKLDDFAIKLGFGDYRDSDSSPETSRAN
jgi:hypothetical protein